MRESQDKANSLSDAREFHDPETAGSSGASHVTSPPLTNPSYRIVPRRDSGSPPETLNMMGISDVFERLPAREGQHENISKIMEFGIFFSWSETKTYWTYDDNRIQEETWATRLIQFEKHSPLWRWNFTSYWWNLFSRWCDGVPEISNLGAASCKIPWLHGIWKLESQFQDWSLCEDSESSKHDVMDHRSWESKVNWWIEYIAINFWENRFHRLWNAGCNDSVCNEEDSQLAHSILEKNMCRRATCSKIRPILTRKTDFVHDLWAFSCTQSLWIGTRPLRLVHFSSPEWWCPRFSMSDGIRHYYQQMNHLRKRSWKDCRSQN